MSNCSKRKIVAQAAKRQQTRSEHRLGKPLEKLEGQLAMFNALFAGEAFPRNRRVWQTNDAGVRVLVERFKRTRRWYWMGAGGCYLSSWCGSNVL